MTIHANAGLRSALLAAVCLLAAGAAGAADPAIAQPSFPIDGEIQTRGLVFFVVADTPTGAAAVGTAHNFDLAKLAHVKRGELVLGHSRHVVARTSGFLVPPGQPFNATGASLADDYVVYALDEKPEGVRLLGLDTSGDVKVGTRVQVLGIPATIPQDEDDLFGRVAEVSPSRIEIDLDVPYDLRGWGGAPVLDDRTHLVIGVLQAHVLRGSTSRVIVAPVSTLRAALGKPLDGGRGRAFATFEQSLAARAAAAPAEAKATASRKPEAAAAHAAGPAPHHAPLIPSSFAEGTRVHLEVEYPPDRASVGDSACGIFVAGRALALHGEMRTFDVVIVIDTSRSTIDPAGADVNGNGIVGKPYLGRIGSIFDVGSTDPGDSILAAEVSAARTLLHGLDPRSTRVGLVTFAGDPPDGQGGLFSRGPRRPAVTMEPLTSDYARIERSLDELMAREPEGSTHMAAGVDQATIELMGLRGALSKPDPKSEKIVLFFTDGQPTLPYGPGFEADNVRAVLRAAMRAHRANIRINSFAIGPDALEGPVATVEMAQRTDGYFTPVRHPGDLVDVVEEVSFANLEGVSVKSLTSGEPAAQFRSTADGSWAAFVKAKPGANRIQIEARATDGSQATQTLEVSADGSGSPPPVPPDLVVARNRLLEDCLKSIKEVRMSAEKEQAEAVRKALLVEIEKERAHARERAEEQRKRLQIEVEDDDATPPPPAK